jgi:hypothetical protein
MTTPRERGVRHMASALGEVGVMEQQSGEWEADVFCLSKYAKHLRAHGVDDVAREAVGMRGRVREAQGLDDFTQFVDVIDRGLVGGYNDVTVPTTYDRIGFRADTKDFSTRHDYQINVPRILTRVAPNGAYLSANAADTQYAYTTNKYGNTWSVHWEAWLRDSRDLGLFRTMMQTWGLSARYTAEYVFTQEWAGDTSVLFTGGHGNYVSGATTNLSITSLETGIATIRQMTDPSGNTSPYMGPLYLVVPPGLEATANAIIDSPDIVIAGTAGTVTRMGNMNSLRGAATVVVNHFLPVIDTTQGTTAWYLFCDPRLRPAVRYGHVTGYDQPELFVRSSNARALAASMAAGNEDPFGGSFDTDSIDFKLRYTFGADQLDYRGAYMSKGAA